MKRARSDKLRTTGAQRELIYTRHQIQKNAGQRNLANLKLNSMWGKLAHNQYKNQTIIVDSEKEFYELLTRPSTEITDVIFPNDDVACVSWKYSEDNVTAEKNVNVAFAVSLTTQSRLKLYEYLSKLGKSVFYFDTGTVIFIQKDNDPKRQKSGLFL